MTLAINRHHVNRKTSTLGRIAAVGVAILFCVAAATPARAQTGGQNGGHAHLVFPINDVTRTVASGCNTDVIPLTIDGFTSINVTVNVIPQIAHIELHQELRGSGTGSPSGSNYILSGIENVSGDAPLPGFPVEVVTVVLKVQLISQGSAPNREVFITDHITMNPDGTIADFHFDIDDVCKG